MSALAGDKKRALKEMIKQLHAGASPSEVKERFKQALAGISPLEISKIEQELIKDGIPREEIQRLCEVHLAVFREQMEKQKLQIPSSHPINILMEEHKIMLQFETGTLLKGEVEAIINTLPIDITFVDEEDTVKFYSASKERIFVRTKAVIGRKVQQYHPQKGVHTVNKILDSFKSGKGDVAEFWIPKENRLIHIRYFSVRNRDSEYLGTIEVTQDVTDIKKIEGEKRLLDWKD